MIAWTRTILIALIVVTAWSADAQDKALPRVLILGDAIYAQNMRPIAGELKNLAVVSQPSLPRGIVMNSANAIEHLDLLLGRIDRNGKPLPEDQWPTWDAIHLNVGLGDLIHRVANMKSFRVLPIHAGGVVTTGPEQYEKNLDTLIRKLKAEAPEATLIWASTTPIRHSRSNVFRMGSEIEYNQIAVRVMKKHGITINDMYTYAKSIMNMDKPAGHGADPFNFDKKPIHGPVLEAIREALGLPAPKPEEESVAAKD